ncbi:hypothetical protein [Methylobacterium sp. C25]|uniref:hypothetical protein n=1 Tax=Methylobacterium sp. C25 TaxID=2721622 RepID=UPI002D807FB3|nr:hypothetical protein [Methylobacterium sp. C25]
MLDEVLSEHGQPLVVSLGPPKFEHHVAAFVVAGLGQTLAERCEPGCEELR